MPSAKDSLIIRAKRLLKPGKPLMLFLGGAVGTVVMIALSTWFLLTWFFPQRFIPVDVTDAKERAELVNANRDMSLKLIQTVGGLGFIATAYFAWRNLQISGRNLQISEDKQVTERFSKAIEMLADKEMTVRLGGIYTLERIARDSPEDLFPIMEVLAAFIRAPRDATEFDSLQSDVRAALTAVTERLNRWDHFEILDLSEAVLVLANLHKADLRSVNLRHADLRRANLRHADLREANLRHADLREASLDNAKLGKATLIQANFELAVLESASLHKASLQRAHMCEAGLMKADLSDAVLTQANLSGAFLSDAVLAKADLSGAFLNNAVLTQANLSEAKLIEANLYDAILNDTSLRDADLSRAKLAGAIISNADLRGANLLGADLSEVKGWTLEQLSQAILCSTKLPDGCKLDPNRDCPK